MGATSIEWTDRSINPMRAGTVTHLHVRDEREWGEFFVHEREPLEQNGRTLWSATWVCYSSYGIFGHHWYSMGEPFAEFIADLNAGYLLRKIGKYQICETKVFESVREAINQAQQRRAVDQDQAADAQAALEQLFIEHTGEVLCHEIYQDEDIRKALRNDFSDIESRVIDPQAVHFAERIWPKFVAEFCQLKEIEKHPTAHAGKAVAR